jgi:hypothetical protein
MIFVSPLGTVPQSVSPSFLFIVLHEIYKEQVYKDGQYIQQKYPLDSVLREGMGICLL